MHKWVFPAVFLLVAVIILAGCQGVRCKHWGYSYEPQYNYTTKTYSVQPVWKCQQWVPVPDGN